MARLTDEEIRELWKVSAQRHPTLAHLPNLGFSHIKRFQDTPANSLLVSYPTPDLQHCIHNETTEEEMREAGITPQTALRLSITAMKHIHGGVRPGALLHHTFDYFNPALIPLFDELAEIWNEDW